MFKDTVNNVTFDFTCASETIAMGLQREILNYTVTQLTAVIEKVLNENNADELIRINKIEIDLGIVNIKELENSILNEFKKLLDAEIKKNRQISDENKKEKSAGFINNDISAALNDTGFGLSKSTSDISISSLSVTQARMEIIREFLLYGDLPWWVDKNSLPDLDSIIQDLLKIEAEAIRIFFKHHLKNKQVITRLKSQFSATTLRLISKLMPGIADSNYFNSGKTYSYAQKNEAYLPDQEFTAQPDFNNKVAAQHAVNTSSMRKPTEQFDLDPSGSITGQFFNSGLKALSKTFKKQLDENNDLKAMMIARFIQGLNSLFFYKIKAMKILSAYQITAINSYLNNYKKNTLQLLNIINALQKLTFFQIEFLLYASSYGNSEVIHMGPPLLRSQLLNKEHSDEETDLTKDKHIKLLLKKLQNKESALFDELYRYANEDLAQLEKLFKQYNLRNTIKNRLIAFLIHHPYFIKRNLLQVPVKALNDIDTLVTDKRLIKQLKKYKAELENILNKLPVENAIIIDDIFFGDAVATEFEMKAVISLLQKLPVYCLQIISKFALLNDDELSAFIQYNNSPENPDSYQSLIPAELSVPFKEEARKIIIENAGLCLVAIYLPRLFANLGYIEKKDFKSKFHRNRALWLLDYIVTGRQKAPEYVMQLNKLLCGLHVTDTITGHKRLTNKEKMEADDLLLSVITNWKSVAGTSLNGFRTSFIQRKGLLTEMEEFWTLQVEKKGFDVLIDSIPWSYSIIKLPWMKKRIHVEW